MSCFCIQPLNKNINFGIKNNKQSIQILQFDLRNGIFNLENELNLMVE